ncbi:MAG TPA: hypothetical protein VLA90_09985 [Actinomycetota bacterium]|nr:hypothetical protein [Actinomycetota bacterium]
MRRIRIEKAAPRRNDRGRYEVLALDPRDPAILRAKDLARHAGRRRQVGR